MLAEVNQVEYGLTCSIWTNDLATAHRTAAAVEAGYVWINEVSKHFLGAPFGGYKQSGIGREECFDEMLAFTQEKNIHVRCTASEAGPSGRRSEPRTVATSSVGRHPSRPCRASRRPRG